jgi:ribosomal protein S18 acetylase RimI-like enzyme
VKIETGKIDYRWTTADDVEAFVDCRIRFLNELGERSGRHPKPEKILVLKKKLREYFSEAIVSNDFFFLLAEHHKNIVGTGALVVWRRPPRYGGLECGKLGYILNLYTVPEARRNGICTRMLHELIKEAKTLGLKYLHLHASEDGIRIYEKAGFVNPEQTELELTLE